MKFLRVLLSIFPWWCIVSLDGFTVKPFVGINKRQAGRLPSLCCLETSTEGGNTLSATQIYFDIEIAGTPVGRLVFELTNPSPLPLHAENIIKLCRGDRVGIDPKATYKGCQFEFSPVYVEGGQYRWGHVLKGYGRNAIGKADAPITDAANQLKCTHSCFGGQYYGDRYEKNVKDADVLLTVPVKGPGHGSSRISIVRVGESPQEWKERLLINSGVIGRLVGDESLQTLQTMARQKVGPPKVTASGVLDQTDSIRESNSTIRGS